MSIATASFSESGQRKTSYHQLRTTIAQVNDKKELTGRTDLNVAVSNHCGRLQMS
jgi:hypothetical protein